MEQLHRDYQIELVPFGSSHFLESLQLRSKAYGRVEAGEMDSIDEHSIHLVALEQDNVVGAMRITCYMHGKLESQERYPPWVLEEFGNTLFAASRLCISPDLFSRTAIPIDLMRAAWRAVLPLGVRIAVSKVRVQAIPFYMVKMGGVYLKDTLFDFDRWNVRCGLVASLATLERHCVFSDLFVGITNPIHLSLLRHKDHFVFSHSDFCQQSASWAQSVPDDAAPSNNVKIPHVSRNG